MQNFDTDRAILERSFGIHLPQVRGILEESDYLNEAVLLGMDAQPSLITQPNAGIPSYFTNYVDPELIEVLTVPNNATLIAGKEVKKGDWTTDTAQFPMIESVGETSSYGDYSETGMSNANANWIPRQSYLYQTITTWGERELERYGAARIDWAARLNISSAITLDKFQNNSYFYGIAGLQNFGILNDPSLPASIAPAAVAGTVWAGKSGDQVYADIQLLYTQLVTQGNGLIDLESKLVLAMSPASQANLTKTNMYGINVSALLKINFPRLRIVTAVQYGTLAGGSLVQMFADDLEGQQTIETAFNEKMRAHGVVKALSSWKEKKSAGTWGAIVRRPFAIASMIGV